MDNSSVSRNRSSIKRHLSMDNISATDLDVNTNDWNLKTSKKSRGKALIKKGFLTGDVSNKSVEICVSCCKPCPAIDSLPCEYCDDFFTHNAVGLMQQRSR